MSHSRRLYFSFLLLANASYLASTENDHDVARYCRLCELHTMCRYPFDDIGTACDSVEDTDIESQDADAIVLQHNEYRNIIASGKETRGAPGPQPAAKNMMELTWDVELAKLARRWAIQCIPGKDECRDVDRFSVWQNVHVLDVGSLESGTSSFHRIPFHIQSWLDDVENFDSAEVGMVDYSKDEQRPYIGIATAIITHIGCGRAMYIENVQIPEGIELKMAQMRNKKNAIGNDSKNINSLTDNSSTKHLASGVHHRRLEVLVCNYGPIDRTTPQNLYEDGMPGQCPTGFDTSHHYEYLCTPREEKTYKRWDDSTMVRNCSNIVRYCVWTSFIFAQLCRTFMNVALSTGW